MFHKNDSPNQTQKSSGLLNDLWSICLSYFYICFNSVEGHKRLSRLSQQSAGYVKLDFRKIFDIQLFRFS